ncbi:MAG: radical SAM protein [Deltaproteobacteria bacterium]|nr:radical SAM protein [Deltaproteobacteria bacterium]
MSSLGFQTIYRAINHSPGRAAHRAFLPDDVASFQKSRLPLFTLEGERSIGDYPIVAFSVAYELEVAGLCQCLELAGIPALAEERDERRPFVLAGGPLTFSNPLPLAPFVDAILMGEADDSVHVALDILFAAGSRREALRELADRVPSAYVPSLHGDEMPPVARADDAHLPARAAIRTPHTELRDMFLIEPERGCHRGCGYCVMRRSTNGGMRPFAAQRVLDFVPEDATRVGLVGAAVTDHPQISEIVETLVDSGKQVGLSSLRADRLTDRFVAALKKGGARVLTTASDGASQRLRDRLQRRAPEDVLRKAAHLVRKHGLDRLKLYMMLGVPDERDEDLDELIAFGTELSSIAKLSLGIAPFVAKRNTPMDGLPFGGIREVERKLAYLRDGFGGHVDLRATSARWAWVEYVLAQGGRAEGLATYRASRAGGRFKDYRREFDALPADRQRRSIVRPGERVKGVQRLPQV